MPEMRESFSPDGPMTAIRALGPGPVPGGASSVSMASLPQQLGGVLELDLPFVADVEIYGLLAYSLKEDPVIAAALDGGGKGPSAVGVAPGQPVSGDFPATIHLPENRLPVPVSRPDTNPRMLSGPSGSAPSGTLSYRM